MRGTKARKYPGSPYGLPAAGPGSPGRLELRALAWVVDALVVLPLLLGRSAPALLVTLALHVANDVAWPWWNGLTFGKWLCGLRIVAVDDEEDEVLTGQRGLTLLTAFTRGFAFALVPVGGTVLWLTMDRDRRTIYDRMTSTIVLTAR